jgi:DNA repair protein RecO
MFVHYRTQGLILRKEERGDADLLFTAYTKDFGKLEILGKAIRKTSSKLRAGAEIFYLSEIEFIQGKTYKTLTDTILIEKFANIKADLKRLRVAYKISRILDDLVKDQEADEKIWRLLRETFKKINKIEITGVKLELLYYYFLWNLVSFLGYRPELRADSICGKKIDPDLAKILKIIIKKDWPVLSKLKITPDHLRLLKNISQWYNKEVCVID